MIFETLLLLNGLVLGLFIAERNHRKELRDLDNQVGNIMKILDLKYGVRENKKKTSNRGRLYKYR